MTTQTERHFFLFWGFTVLHRRIQAEEHRLVEMWPDSRQGKKEKKPPDDVWWRHSGSRPSVDNTTSLVGTALLFNLIIWVTSHFTSLWGSCQLSSIVESLFCHSSVRTQRYIPNGGLLEFSIFKEVSKSYKELSSSFPSNCLISSHKISLHLKSIAWKSNLFFDPSRKVCQIFLLV